MSHSKSKCAFSNKKWVSLIITINQFFLHSSNWAALCYQGCLGRWVHSDTQWTRWKRTDYKHTRKYKSNYKFRGPIPPLFFIQKDANQMEYKQPEPRLKLHDLASSQMKPVMKPDHWLFIKHEKPLCFKCFSCSSCWCCSFVTEMSRANTLSKG